jgi:ATP-dependent Clp protease protease subunit
MKKRNKQQAAPKVSNKVLGLLGAAALILALVIVGKTVSNKPVSGVSPTIVNISKPELPLSNEVQTNDVQLVGKSLTKLNIDFSRAVFLVGEVDESVLQQISQIQQLAAMSSEPIYLLLESPGGSVFDGYKLLSAMESSRAPIYTVAMGLCASMCSVILEYGAKRYMFDRATLMFHDAAGGFQGEMKKMQTRMNYVNRALEKVDRAISAKIGISYDKYTALHQNELWLDAEDALKLHFIDAVVATEYPMMLQTERVPPPEEEKNKKAKVLDIRLVTE